MTMFIRSLLCCLSLQFSFFPLLCCVFLRKTWLAGIRPGQRLGPTKHKYAVMLAKVCETLWPNGQGVGLLQQHLSLRKSSFTRPCGPMDKALVYFNTHVRLWLMSCRLTTSNSRFESWQGRAKKNPSPKLRFGQAISLMIFSLEPKCLRSIL